MNPTLNPTDFLDFLAMVAVLAAMGALAFVLEVWARRIRKERRARYSQATRIRSHAERECLRARRHLNNQRPRAIAELGEAWVLHPNYRGGRK